ncbi:MAG: hypothetical protein ACRYFX_16350 [Janthinobacterium lividum]
MEYFYLASLGGGSIAVACPPENTPPAYLLADAQIGKNKLPFDLALKNIVFDKNGSKELDNLQSLKHIWLDYQPNCLAWPIFSDKLADILSSNASPEADINWIDVTINKGTEESRKYHILRFNSQQEVLNREESLFSGSSLDFLVRPVFARESIKDLALFCSLYTFPTITGSLYVNSAIKLAIRAAKLSGVIFEYARVL